MNKIILVLMLSVGFTLAGCKEGKSEESKAVAELKAKCEELTKSDKANRVYEVPMGRLVDKKTTVTTIEGRQGTKRIGKITLLDNKNKEIIIYSETMTDKNSFKKYRLILDRVIFNNRARPDFENYEYGACSYKNSEGKYIVQLDTLTLIKGEKLKT